jgi:hypothetical protein
MEQSSGKSNSCLISQEIFRFFFGGVGLESSLLCSQVPATGPTVGPNESISQPLTLLYIKDVIIIHSNIKHIETC